MSKSSFIAQLLQNGEPVERYKEGGNSMLPILKSNQPVTLTPVKEETELKIGDIVFCRVGGRYVTHKIHSIRGKQYQIGNNRGYMNGWVTKQKIFGLVTKIWDK
ncbi:phage repressor protein [Bacillus sp. M6-12]|uniref:phage repressor protein n=1 Tax=Bacillus sp. M6-12 TaxID=2054166 RepID=UPI000C78DC11|nr:phage repressor protein [Bacillus sp. M6-12]PLS19397.1 phage repressor protein [Bacillus sp. M6-12]